MEKYTKTNLPQDVLELCFDKQNDVEIAVEIMEGERDGAVVEALKAKLPWFERITFPDEDELAQSDYLKRFLTKLNWFYTMLVVVPVFALTYLLVYMVNHGMMPVTNVALVDNLVLQFSDVVKGAHEVIVAAAVSLIFLLFTLIIVCHATKYKEVQYDGDDLLRYYVGKSCEEYAKNKKFFICKKKHKQAKKYQKLLIQLNTIDESNEEKQKEKEALIREIAIECEKYHAASNDEHKLADEWLYEYMHYDD